MGRDVFSELLHGLDDLADERQGKLTLRTHKLKLPKPQPLSVEQLVALESNQAIEAEQLHNKRIGAMKDKLVLPGDYDTPLPDEILDAFEALESEATGSLPGYPGSVDECG
ncbi:MULTISPECIES: hypothetical protein [unclassified Pseudomonas]|jgi:hypothetical protein|uniref:hypothetical protein n=1 Tax=unclassified Pseudomonas TaxID=196821 RepID=UPI001F4F665F|nr:MULTISPECIES: hypothetical protein [unclassified Pseudomonas]